MKKLLLAAALFAACLLFSNKSFSQNVGIGTNSPNSSAMLDVSATNKGILIPRVTAAQRLLIAPVNGLMVYDLDSSSLFIYEASSWKRLRAISNLSTLVSGTAIDDVLVWNGSQWVVTPKCSLFTYYFRDQDGDGFGDKYRPVAGCTPLPGFVSDSADCDDTNPSAYPGATEICNGIDDDCDGVVDEGCLKVNVLGNGSGGVSSSPAGIVCPSDCSEQFSPSTIVTLMALPNAGSVFSGWSGGGCSGTGTCVVSMATAQTVNAVFTLQQFQLTVNTAGAGTGSVSSSPAGINCPPDCSELYNYGDLVTLSATAGFGSTFTGWSGACTGTGPCVVSMDAARTVTANFDLMSYNLNVVKPGNGTGTVTSSPAGISCGADCNESYSHGTIVTLTATASVGSAFSGWSGSGCSGTGSCVVTMDAAKNVSATFTLNQYAVTVIKSGTGSGTVTSSPSGINCGADCFELYDHGTTVTLSAVPDAGSTFAGWSGACSGTGPCVVNVTSPTNVTATFVLNTYALTVTKTGSGSGTVTSSPTGINCGVDCSEFYTHGTIVTLTATASPGNSFAGWSGACTGSGTCVVSMTTARAVTATFTFPEPEPLPVPQQPDYTWQAIRNTTIPVRPEPNK